MDVPSAMTATQISDFVTAGTLPANATLYQTEGKIKFRWTVTVN
jgi:hypothetical protein